MILFKLFKTDSRFLIRPLVIVAGLLFTMMSPSAESTVCPSPLDFEDSVLPSAKGWVPYFGGGNNSIQIEGGNRFLRITGTHQLGWVFDLTSCLSDSNTWVYEADIRVDDAQNDTGITYSTLQGWEDNLSRIGFPINVWVNLRLEYNPTTGVVERFRDGVVLTPVLTSPHRDGRLDNGYPRNFSTFDREIRIFFANINVTRTVDFDNVQFSVGNPLASDAGPDRSEDEGLMVTLDGSASTGAVNYAWTQIAGPSVTLSDPTVISPTFFAPFVPANTTLSFHLIVDDGAGNFSQPDTVDVTVVDVNSPPVADAGDDSTVKEGAVATLNGSLSFDPEGDTPLGYTWMQTTGPLVTLQPGDTVVSPTLTAPLGVGNMLTFELVVDDGRESSIPDSVTITVVENTAPIADAGPDQTVDEGTIVNLDGTASSDADGGDTLSFDWTEPVPLDDDASPIPSFTAPFVSQGGQNIGFDLVVTDDDPIDPKSSAADSVTISVRNVNDPPSCDLARAWCPDSKIRNNDGCTLWPPNHKLIEVSLEGVMDTDATYNDITLVITGVTQDEPVNGGGDGDSSPDAVIQSDGQVDTVLIRAERQGGDNGRVYTVSFTANDGFESCNGSVTVDVPHNRKDAPVDDGQVYDSTVP